VTATENRATINRILIGGTAVAVCQTGVYKGDKFVRRVDFSDIPAFIEVLGNRKPTGLPWQAFMAWIGPSLVDKFLSAPPNTPDKYVSILRNAFAQASKDPKFDDQMRKVSEDYVVGIGDETERLLKNSVGVPREAVAYAEELKLKFGMK